MWFRLRSVLRRRAVESELDDELRFHSERQFAKYFAEGLSEEEAARRVRLEFGGLSQVKDDCRDERGVQMWDNFARDLQFGTRSLLRAPGFTLIALLALALGIGANTAVFSILYGVLLQPLPLRDPGRLLVLNETTPKVGLVSVSYPNYKDWRNQARSFSGMSYVVNIAADLTGTQHPESLDGMGVSTNFLSLLGIRPYAGRDFLVGEKAPAVLISYPLWQSHFDGASGAIGRTISLSQHPFTIVGVLPPDFRWTERTDFLEPVETVVAANTDYNGRGNRSDATVIARLSPGAATGQALAEMNSIAARLAATYPGDDAQFGVALQPVREVFAGDLRRPILVLFVAALFVLLIACTNVGNLLLVRGIGRARELSLRMALGATGRRILAQMITESLILTVSGAVAGVLVAYALVHGISHMIPVSVLHGASVKLSTPSLLFAGAVSVLSATAFGIAPALRTNLVLKKWTRTTLWRDGLAITEVSLALILLVGAGLMTKSLSRLMAVDAGLRTDHVISMDIPLRAEQYKDDAARLTFWTKLLEKVRSLPGVTVAALGTNVPMTDEHSRSDILIEGMPLPKPGGSPHPDVHIVTPGYFHTLGLQLLRGRLFTEFDNERGDLVALINSRIAHQFYGGRDPVGTRVQWGGKWIKVVGIVQDTKLYGLENPSRLEIYIPFRQKVPHWMTVVARSSKDPAALANEFRGAVAQVDRDQVVDQVATLHDLAQQSIWTQRTVFLLLSCFSGIALLLAAFGIYGIISFSVAQRTQEIGVRMALGARPSDVVRLVVRQGARIAIAGGGIGIVLALGLTRLMTKLLYSVSSFDPGTFAGVTAVLLGTALLAAYVPARRSSHIDPATALRSD